MFLSLLQLYITYWSFVVYWLVTRKWEVQMGMWILLPQSHSSCIGRTKTGCERKWAVAGVRKARWQVVCILVKHLLEPRGPRFRVFVWFFVHFQFNLHCKVSNWCDVWKNVHLLSITRGSALLVFCWFTIYNSYPTGHAISPYFQASSICLS